MHRIGRRERRESQYSFARRKRMHLTNRGPKNQPAMAGTKYNSFERTGGNLSAISALSAVNYSGQGMHTAKILAFAYHNCFRLSGSGVFLFESAFILAGSAEILSTMSFRNSGLGLRPSAPWYNCAARPSSLVPSKSRARW
jgi:hypothetical protein